MGTVVALREAAGVAEAAEAEALVTDIMRALRARSGLTPEGFARALNERSTRNPGLIGGCVRTWEAGIHPVPGDLIGIALLVAGLPAAQALGYILALATAGP